MKLLIINSFVQKFDNCIEMWEKVEIRGDKSSDDLYRECTGWTLWQNGEKRGTTTERWIVEDLFDNLDDKFNVIVKGGKIALFNLATVCDMLGIINIDKEDANYKGDGYRLTANKGDVFKLELRLNGVIKVILNWECICPNFALKIPRDLWHFAVKEQLTFLNKRYLSIGSITHALTAGSLGLRLFMSDVMGNGDVFEGRKYWNKYFAVDAEADKNYREQSLYRGGLDFVNPRFKNKTVTNGRIYDKNSLYPFILREMEFPIYSSKEVVKLNVIRQARYREFLKLYHITAFCGVLKKGRLPIWADTLTGEYVDVIREYNPLYIWEEELDTLSEYYDLDYKVIDVEVFKPARLKRLKPWVDYLYNSRLVSPALKVLCKNLLNALGGKLGQKEFATACKWSGSEIQEHEIPPESRKGVVGGVLVASRMTALARVNMAKIILETFGDKMTSKVIYMATDSIHTREVMPPSRCDDSQIGLLKLEAEYEKALYRAPKCYVYKKKGTGEIVPHCRSISQEELAKTLNDGRTWRKVILNFKTGKRYPCQVIKTTPNGRYYDTILRTMITEGDLSVVDSEMKNAEFE